MKRLSSMSLSVAPSRLANFLTTDFPISCYILVKNRKVMKKSFCSEKSFWQHISLLEKMAVESLKIQISLAFVENIFS